MSGVFRTIDPPPTLHPASVSSPHTKGGGYILAGLWGVGRSTFWKTPDIGLASYSIISLRFYLTVPFPILMHACLSFIFMCFCPSCLPALSLHVNLIYFYHRLRVTLKLTQKISYKSLWASFLHGYLMCSSLSQILQYFVNRKDHSAQRGVLSVQTMAQDTLLLPILQLKFQPGKLDN